MISINPLVIFITPLGDGGLIVRIHLHELSRHCFQHTEKLGHLYQQQNSKRQQNIPGKMDGFSYDPMFKFDVIPAGQCGPESYTYQQEGEEGIHNFQEHNSHGRVTYFEVFKNSRRDDQYHGDPTPVFVEPGIVECQVQYY